MVTPRNLTRNLALNSSHAASPSNNKLRSANWEYPHALPRAICMKASSVASPVSGSILEIQVSISRLQVSPCGTSGSRRVLQGQDGWRRLSVFVDLSGKVPLVEGAYKENSALVRRLSYCIYLTKGAALTVPPSVVMG